MFRSHDLQTDFMTLEKQSSDGLPRVLACGARKKHLAAKGMSRRAKDGKLDKGVTAKEKALANERSHDTEARRETRDIDTTS